MTLVLIYVDDIVITGSDSRYISDLIKLLSMKFVMKDLENLHYLGIEVQSTPSRLFLSQTKYATELLHKARMIERKPSDSPSSVKPGLPDPNSIFRDASLYTTIVDSLQYLTLTKPKISFM